MASTSYYGVNNELQIGNNHGTIPAEFHLPKRQKTFHHDGLPTPPHEQYTIAWICALHIEMAAAQAMLDDIHEPLPTHADDINTYVLGSVKQHNVVIACLPAEQYGTNNAAKVMTNMKRTFSGVRAGLMVGIGGGVPSKADVRLGDVVVGTRVMQYDLGKIVGDGKFQRTAIPRIPDLLLGTAVSALRSKHELGPSRISSILQQKLEAHPEFGRPSSPDRLFQAMYDHVSSSKACCDKCDHSKLVSRTRRVSDNVMIHYGAIASGNQVMKHGTTRDNVARELDVICFEMEAAGLMDIIPCLPVRGICDYSDSHKSKEWQRYAAATAAAYTRELLEELPVTESRSRPALAKLQQTIQDLRVEVRELRDRLRIQQRQLPPQVPFRDLVAVNDALGETYCFSLNLIDSLEAFVTTVLTRKFEHVGLGKIERGEWMLQNHHTGQILNLNMHWKAVVKPGQTLDMSMIFRKRNSLTILCPWCDTENECSSDKQHVECRKCSGRYRRIEEVNEIGLRELDSQSASSSSIAQQGNNGVSETWSSQPKKKMKEKKKRGLQDDGDDIHLYTRVQMVDVRFRIVQQTLKASARLLRLSAQDFEDLEHLVENLAKASGLSKEDCWDALQDRRDEFLTLIAAAEKLHVTNTAALEPNQQAAMQHRQQENAMLQRQQRPQKRPGNGVAISQSQERPVSGHDMAAESRSIPDYHSNRPSKMPNGEYPREYTTWTGEHPPWPVGDDLSIGSTGSAPLPPHSGQPPLVTKASPATAVEMTRSGTTDYIISSLNISSFDSAAGLQAGSYPISPEWVPTSTSGLSYQERFPSSLYPDLDPATSFPFSYDAPFSMSTPSSTSFQLSMPSASVLTPADAVDTKQSHSADSNTSRALALSRVVRHPQKQIAHGTQPIAPKWESHDSIHLQPGHYGPHKIVRISSADGTPKEVAPIPKASVQRPPRPRTYCHLCNDQPEGFHDEHELRQHIDRVHVPKTYCHLCNDQPEGFHGEHELRQHNDRMHVEN